jgi:hypothetical protein
MGRCDKARLNLTKVLSGSARRPPAICAFSVVSFIGCELFDVIMIAVGESGAGQIALLNGMVNETLSKPSGWNSTRWFWRTVIAVTFFRKKRPEPMVCNVESVVLKKSYMNSAQKKGHQTVFQCRLVRHIPQKH